MLDETFDFDGARLAEDEPADDGVSVTWSASLGERLQGTEVR